MDIQIEKAKKEDLSRILELGKMLTQSEMVWIKDNTPEWFLGKEGIKFISKRIRGYGGAIFVAREKDIVIGYIVIGTVQNHVWRGKMRVAYIENIYICEEYRGKGIGTLLMDKAKIWAKIKRVNTLHVEIIYQNTKAEDFYSKFGFHPYSKVLEVKI